MRLTNRDEEIVRSVYLYQILSREQIELLLFSPDKGQDHPTKTSRARKRLKLLYQHGYLERIPVPVEPGLWAWRPLYRLDEKGAQLLADQLGTSAAKLSYWGKRFDQDHRQADVGLLFIEHRLGINDFRIAISLAAEKESYQIDKWLDDTQLKSQEMKDYVTVSQGQSRKRVVVIPDAYFILNLGELEAHFFLELDRATTTSERWRTRVLAYLRYVETSMYQDRYHTTSLRILTVTTTPERVANLKKVTEKAGGGKMFWFTTLDQVTPESVLHSSIWVRASEDSPRCLIA